MNSSEREFNYLMSLQGLIFCILMLVVGLYEHFVLEEGFSSLFSFVHLAMIALFSGVSVLAIKRNYTPLNQLYKNFDRKEIFLLFITLGAGLFCLFYENSMRSIRLDEYTQFYNVYQPTYSISNYAAQSQQTPMDYYLSYLAAAAFDFELITYRFFPFLIFLTSISFINRTTKILNYPLLVRFLLPLLYISIPIISYQSVEARPIYLIMHFGLILFLYFANSSTKDNWCPWSFALVSFLFTFSAGLQPIIIYCLLIGFLFLLGFFKLKRHPRIFVGFLLVSLFGLVNSLYIRHVSLPMNQFHNDWMEKFNIYLNKVSLTHLEPYLRGFYPFAFLALFLLVLSIYFRKKIEYKTKLFLVGTLLSMGSFVLIFDSFYYTYVNWFPIVDRYVIVIPIFGYFVLFILIGTISKLKISQYSKVLFNSIIVLSIVGAVFAHEFLVKHYRTHESIPTKEMYTDIKKVITDQTSVLFIKPGSIKGNNVSLWIAPRVYLDDEQINYLSKYSLILQEIQHFQFVTDLQDLKDRNVNQLVLVVYHEPGSQIRSLIVKNYPDSLLETSSDRYGLFQIKLSKENQLGNIVKLFKFILDNADPSISFTFFKVLLHYGLTGEDLELINYLADFYKTDHFWVDKKVPMAIDYETYKNLKSTALEALERKKFELINSQN